MDKKESKAPTLLSGIEHGKDMTCIEMESFIVDYIDEKLPEHQRSAFVSHLSDCPDCDSFLRNYRNTISYGQAAYSNDNIVDCKAIPENVVQAILSANKKSS